MGSHGDIAISPFSGRPYGNLAPYERSFPEDLTGPLAHFLEDPKAMGVSYLMGDHFPQPGSTESARLSWDLRLRVNFILPGNGPGQFALIRCPIRADLNLIFNLPGNGFLKFQLAVEDPKKTNRKFSPHRGFWNPHGGSRNPHRGFPTPFRGFKNPHNGFQNPHNGFQNTHKDSEICLEDPKTHMEDSEICIGIWNPHRGFQNPHGGFWNPQLGL